AGRRKAIVDADIAVLRPSARLQSLTESRETRLGIRIVLGKPHQHADTPHPFRRLLRARRKRPRLRSAEQRDERAPSHSVHSSAVTSSLSGTLMPSILAVGALMTSSNLDACTTGRSAGLAPFRMRPV